MSKRRFVFAVLALSLNACAPALQQPAAVCTDVAAHEAITCTPTAPQQVAEQQQEPQKKSPPEGPGKKDFTLWMVLLTMGFGALYLMAFK